MEAKVGIIGGSGFYSLLENAKSIEVDTKYGKPSASISVGEISGKSVAFIPRHGNKHNFPPHMVPYRANLQALKDLGVERIIATNATGSLNPNFKVGQIVAFDQFVNFTNGRKETFFEDRVVHVSTADPYCTHLRRIASNAAKKSNIDYKDGGSVLVINGPRFSTKAESLFFSEQGFDLINMTQYPEVALAKELSLCYLALGIVTDYDAGLIANAKIKPVSHAEVMETFSQNIGKVKSLIKDIIKEMPDSRECDCAKSLDGASVSV